MKIVMVIDDTVRLSADLDGNATGRDPWGE